MPVDPTVVRNRLRRLERCLETLRSLRGDGRDAVVRDRAIQDRLERNVQLAGQVCADIALHISAASGCRAPETYADALDVTADLGVIPEDLARRLRGLIRLRNLLVHEYLDVDHSRLYDELSWIIDDATTFGETVERWLQAQGFSP